MNDYVKTITAKLPFILAVILFVSSIFWFVYSVLNVSVLFIAVQTGVMHTFNQLLKPLQINFILFIFINLLLIVGYLYSTRIKKFENPNLRKFYFLIIWLGVTASYLWLMEKGMYQYTIPYIESMLSLLEFEETSFLSVLVNEESNATFLLTLFPVGVTFIFFMIGLNAYTSYRDELTKAFRDYKWTGRLLQKLELFEGNDTLPSVKLGKNVETKEDVIQPGYDRTLNNIIVGSIGTGKTSALGLPIINQDLHHMTRFINDFPKIGKLENYDSEEVKGQYLNGISIIEPSNDLCQQVLKLAKAHNIPDEAITYIDPTNPNTPNINPMKGPVEKVAEGMAQVIEGLNEAGDSGNFFFEQAQRNHLKQYIYLLKLHDEEKEVTFDMLIDMYNNPQLVREMHVKLKERIPKNIEGIEDRDEYNRWKIIQQVDEWFDANLLPEMQKMGGNTVPVVIKEGKYRNQIKYYDAKAEFVQGLRNILNDIGANTLIRRVLFGKSDFDFDVHLERGGLLLVNTAKGELMNLSNVFGKIVLISLQNAVFRRTPKVSTYHHILVDEAPDYLYQPFREFPSQSRKYKTIVTILLQTISQLADRYGEFYLNTLVGSLRHRMVYGDVPAYDAKYFSEYFGDEFRYEEQSGEQVVSPLQEDPMVRQHNTYQRKQEAKMTPSDIIYQDAFHCAVKIVVNNRPIPVQQIEANFVPKKEFESSPYKVKRVAAEKWLEERRKFGNQNVVPVINDVQEAEESLTKDMEEELNAEIKQEEQANLIVDFDDMPKDEVQYVDDVSNYQNIPLSSSFEYRNAKNGQSNELEKSEHFTEELEQETATDLSASESTAANGQDNITDKDSEEEKTETSSKNGFKVSEPPKDAVKELLSEMIEER